MFWRQGEGNTKIIWSVRNCLSLWKLVSYPPLYLHKPHTPNTHLLITEGLGSKWILEWVLSAQGSQDLKRHIQQGTFGYISQRKWPQQWEFPTIRWLLIFNSFWLGGSSFPPNTSLLSHPCALGSTGAFQKARSTRDLFLITAWERGTNRLRCLLSMCFSSNVSTRICHLWKPVSMELAKKNESKFGSP